MYVYMFYMQTSNSQFDDICSVRMDTLLCQVLELQKYGLRPIRDRAGLWKETASDSAFLQFSSGEKNDKHPFLRDKTPYANLQ